ncbi:hypothetical protein GCM10023219_20460 [Stakelama sediminis]|uniref:Lipoprotein n=1 Tax=Stakelama sediminis TaxID=463200 RepID=A0A840Z2X2_9SPHN|nr:hypothetical protein [Stakelama sediminis]MBB5720348.1 hypothetical protein [Stakelama sediminis]
MRQETNARLIVTPLVMALVLTGCGKGNKGLDATGNVASAPTPRDLGKDEKPSGAMDNWGKKIDITCPATFPIPQRPADAPVDDVRGLRLGVSGNTAIRFAQCKDGKVLDSVYAEGDESFNHNSGGLKIRTMATVATGTLPDYWYRTRFNGDFEQDPSKKLAHTDAIWHFLMDGMPGKEKLYGIWLEQPFAKGSQPTVASQAAALKKKYGEPNYTDSNGRAYWLHLPNGQPIPEFNRDLLHRCSRYLSASQQSLSFDPECGLVITASLTPAQNPMLAQSVNVAAADPAALYDYEQNHFEAERDATLASQASQQASNATGGTF